MIQMKVYINKSEDNKIGKDLQLIADVQGTLKNETSIINPVFIVSSELATLVPCNYLEIPSFGRKYFIKDIKSLRTGLCEISCHVDVLDSFKDQLLLQKGIVNRQENRYNLYLDDSSLKCSSKPNADYSINTRYFPNGFDGHSYIFIVAG